MKPTSSGPAVLLAGADRRDGRHFRMFKFRTMYVDADARLEALREQNEASGPIFKMRDDPRVTPRRPLAAEVLDRRGPAVHQRVRRGDVRRGASAAASVRDARVQDRHWRRLEVTPGMTGLWQVSGRSSLTFEEMVRLDLFYIENWSVGLDLAIILRTVPAVLFARARTSPIAS